MKLKRIILIAAALLLLLAVFVSCAGGNKNKDEKNNGTDSNDDNQIGNTVGEEGIRIDSEGDIEIDVGKTLGVKAINLSTGMVTSNVIWKIEDESVATVSASGLLTGVKEGSTVVSATTIDGKYNASCTVNVTLRLSGVGISYEEYDLEIGDSVKLEALPIPSEFVGASYTWMSSVPSVASVDSNGLVTAKSLGSTSIMVEAVPGGFTAICSVNVGKYAESISLAFENITVNKGLSMSLGFEMYPSDATSRPHWKSSDERVVIVNSGGVITALACGSSTITVSTTNGLSASVNVTVISALERFEFVDREISGKKNFEVKPDINFFPSDATNKNLIWTSSDESILKVTEAGKLMAVANGTVTLTAVSEDGGYTDSCVVIITNPLSSIKFPGTPDKNTGKYPKVSLPYGSETKIEPIITPIDADELPLLVWTSSDPNVIKVAPDGTITTVARGTATVTLGLPNGISASFDVEVTKEIFNVEKVEFDSPVYYMKPNGTLTVGIRYFPEASEEDATLYSLVSNDKYVASYDKETGIITAHVKGECTITVTVVSANNKLVRASATIIVLDSADGLDEQYKNDIHALRDGELLAEIKAGLERIEAIADELTELRNALAAENEKEIPDEELVAQYNSEIEALLKESEELEQTIIEKKKEYAALEKGIMEKYSSLKDSLTYDPSNDPYPQELSDSAFVKISDYISDAVVDLRYSTENNGLGKAIYSFSDAYLRYGTLKKLAEVADQLAFYDLKLVIWDAYRPTSCQDAIWAALDITDGAYGAESCGSAVSISLVKTDGSDTEMPSDFGDSTEKADREYSDTTEVAEGNIALLELLMSGAGFELGDNWWQFVDSTEYPVETEFLN